MSVQEIRAARENATRKLENLLAVAKSTKNVAVWQGLIELAEALSPAISPLLTSQEARELAGSTRGLKEAFEKFSLEYDVSFNQIQAAVKDVLDLYANYIIKLTAVAVKESDVLERLDRVLTQYG